MYYRMYGKCMPSVSCASYVNALSVFSKCSITPKGTLNGKIPNVPASNAPASSWSDVCMARGDRVCKVCPFTVSIFKKNLCVQGEIANGNTCERPFKQSSCTAHPHAPNTYRSHHALPCPSTIPARVNTMTFCMREFVNRTFLQ